MQCIYWLILAAMVAVNLAVLPYFVFLLAIGAGGSRAGRREPSRQTPSSRFLIVDPRP